MDRLLPLIWLCSCFFFPLVAFVDLTPTQYPLTEEPIDVVIPACAKDLPTLDLCIAGIREQGSNIRRIIVVSAERLTNHAEWFDEGVFPFSKFDVALQLHRMNKKAAAEYLLHPQSRVGWFYQQLLKLYSIFVIPNLSSNVLVLDADTVFFRPIHFLSEANGALFNTAIENHQPYYMHMNRLLPGLKKVFPDRSGISHHMLFQRPVIEDLFNQVESTHGMDFWKAFCQCVDLSHYSAASEYEIYFNFVFTRTDQVELRQLHWMNSSFPELMGEHRNMSFDFVSYHSCMR